MTNLILRTRGLHAAEGDSSRLIDNRGICPMERPRGHTRRHLALARTILSTISNARARAHALPFLHLLTAGEDAADARAHVTPSYSRPHTTSREEEIERREGVVLSPRCDVIHARRLVTRLRVIVCVDARSSPRRLSGFAGDSTTSRESRRRARGRGSWVGRGGRGSTSRSTRRGSRRG